MLIKEADSKQESLDTLQSLLERKDLSSQQRKAITQELYMMRAGIKGEKEAAYELDFFFKGSKNYILLHDLRLEVNGRVAQIDHLILDRTLIAYVLETKHFNAGIKINEQGEFLRWNDYKKAYEGFPSPIAQNERHITVLNDFFKNSEMPKRLGIKLIPKSQSYVLVSNNARIDRPKEFDTSRVIKCETFTSTIKSELQNIRTKDLLLSVGRIVSQNTIASIGRILKYSHKPKSIDYLARFGLSEKPEPAQKKVEQPPKPAVSAVKPKPIIANAPQQCSKCQSTNIEVKYGRNYYFKCLACEGNTAIKLSCLTDDCKPRLRKKKHQFFKECAQCQTSEVYFENKPVPA